MKKLLVAVMVGFLVSSLIGCGSNPFRAKGTVQGQIRDSITSQAITGALVRIGGESTRTNNNGVFELEVAVGDHDVFVSADGYLDATVATVRVVEDQTVWIDDVFLTPSHVEGEEEVVFLADLAPAGGWSVNRGQANLDGVRYFHAIFDTLWGSSTQDIEWNISRQYTRLRVILGVSDNEPDIDGRVRFEILGDGVALYQSGEMRVGDSPEIVDVSVEGVLRLRISATHISGTPDTVFVLGDPRISKPK